MKETTLFAMKAGSAWSCFGATIRCSRGRLAKEWFGRFCHDTSLPSCRNYSV